MLIYDTLLHCEGMSLHADHCDQVQGARHKVSTTAVVDTFSGLCTLAGSNHSFGSPMTQCPDLVAVQAQCFCTSRAVHYGHMSQFLSEVSLAQGGRKIFYDSLVRTHTAVAVCLMPGDSCICSVREHNAFCIGLG